MMRLEPDERVGTSFKKNDEVGLVGEGELGLLNEEFEVVAVLGSPDAFKEFRHYE